VFFLRPGFGRVIFWTALTSFTAFVSRWLSNAVDAYPRSREAGPAAACSPAAARDEQRLADTPLWPLVERVIAWRALEPFIVRPTFERLRILNVDFGPGGVALALHRRAPLDATVVATDSVTGMADLALDRATQRNRRRQPHFVQSWSHGLPFRDGSFDLVVAAGALHGWPYPEQALAEIRRVLKPAGRYLIADLRRDLPMALWLGIQSAAPLVPGNLRALGEPGASIRAAYAPHEVEWLAARAGLPESFIAPGPAWIMMERKGGSVAPHILTFVGENRR
jgi:SAM-dependent methyltransferase